jgi:internalin A
MSQEREHLFISYCREDSKWLEKFREMLAPLLRKDQFKIWDDTKITPGTKWYQEIEKAVATSKVALLLVSARFLASDFIIDTELRLLNDAQADGLTILWVAVSRCMYQYTDLADYQALNDPTKTLDSLTPAKLNQEMVRICKQIKKAMDATPQQSII